MNVFQNEVGEHSAPPQLMVAGTRFDMKTRLIDSKGNILASRPYEVQVSPLAISESGDATSNPNVLLGQGEITTITDFASEFAGVYVSLTLQSQKLATIGDCVLS